MTPALLESLRVLGYAAKQVKPDGLPLSLSRAVETLITELDEALPVGDMGEGPVPLLLRRTKDAQVATARKIVAAEGRCDDVECVDCPDFCSGSGDLGIEDTDALTLERAKAWLAEYVK
jgi:hypothetical protein